MLSRACLVTAILFSCLPAAHAGPGIGIRAGLTDDVDSAFAGAHLRLAPNQLQGLWLEPIFEWGVGERDIGLLELDYRTIRVGLTAKYARRLGGTGELYGFPLVGFDIYDLSLDDCRKYAYADVDCGDTEVGARVGGGLEWKGVGVELALGIGDVPDVVLAIAYTFEP